MVRGLFVIAAVAACLVAVALGGSPYCAEKAKAAAAFCTFHHSLFEWQTLISGVLAILAGGVTVFGIQKQIDQAETHRQEDWRRKTMGTTTVANIDLWDTADRLREADGVDDLANPPLSATAYSLIGQLSVFAPVLAAAVQKHCTELHAFITKARSNPLVPEYFDEEKVPIAYRSYVLSRCFSNVSFRLLKSGIIGRDYITREELAQIRSEFGTDDADDGFLEHVFRETGIG